jgi:hypothetical protein
MAHVEIPTAIAFLDRHLEWRPPVDFGVSDDPQVPRCPTAGNWIGKSAGSRCQTTEEKRRDQTAANLLPIHVVSPFEEESVAEKPMSQSALSVNGGLTPKHKRQLSEWANVENGKT